jgi:hypothetical protein
MNVRPVSIRATFFVLAIGFGLSACAQSSTGTGSGGVASDNGAVYDAWRAARSHVEVTANGSVARMLGTRPGRSGNHEGFLLHLSGSAGRGLTVRVEDNVDLTGPIPLSEGQNVVVRGEYIFDQRGGVVHYTHRDPRGRHVSGYVLVDGKFYQ